MWQTRKFNLILGPLTLVQHPRKCWACWVLLMWRFKGLQHSIVKLASSLSPNDMIKKEKSLGSFKVLADKIVKLKWIFSKDWIRDVYWYRICLIPQQVFGIWCKKRLCWYVLGWVLAWEKIICELVQSLNICLCPFTGLKHSWEGLSVSENVHVENLQEQSFIGQ